MAVKTFAAGDVLTASDTNTYLNNGGLVYITGASLTGTTANFDNCFSSTYDNYQIVLSGTGSTVGNVINCQLRTGSGNEALSSYYWGGWYALYGSGTLTGEGATTSVTQWRVGEMTSTGGAMIMDVLMPNLAAYTSFFSIHQDYANYSRQHNGYKATTTQYTGIGFIFSGTSWAGSIRIYGRRQA